VFEDQLGARHALSDTSPLQAGLGALGYQAAMAAHARNFSAALLGTEQGYDRLAQHVVGFFGNNIEVALQGSAGWPWYGANFTPYPAAAALLGPSVLSHVHNLETGVFAVDAPRACWALATGARLSIDGSALFWAAPPARAFASAMAALQSVVVSQWTGYALSEYQDLRVGGLAASVGLGATRSVFTAPAALLADPLFASASPAYAVLTNWANADSLAVLELQGGRQAVLPPRGCVAYGSAWDVVGGVFSAYNGRPLPGTAPHIVIEDRACAAYGQGAVCVWHGVGEDTELGVVAPPACAEPLCAARDAAGALIAAVPCTLEGTLVTFAANASLTGKAVDFFSIVC